MAGGDGVAGQRRGGDTERTNAVRHEALGASGIKGCAGQDVNHLTGYPVETRVFVIVGEPPHGDGHSGSGRGDG